MCLCLCWSVAQAGIPSSVLVDGEILSLRNRIDYLQDAPTVTPEKLLAGVYDNSFRRYDRAEVNFRNSGAVWLRVRLTNNTSRMYQVLSLNDVLFTEVDLLYNRAEDGAAVEPVRRSAGLLQGTAKQQWPYYDAAFLLDIPRNQARTIYLRVYTPYFLLLAPYVSDEQTYNLKQIRQASWGHLMVGVMIGVLIYLVMISLTLRTVPEVWSCAGFVAVSFLVLVYRRGYLFPYLSDLHWIKQHLYMLLFAAQAFAYVVFSRQHFDTRNGFPHIDRLLQACLVVSATIFFISLVVPVPWVVTAIGLMGLCIPVTLLVVSIYVWANSERHLTVYIVGTVLFLFSYIFATLESSGFLDLSGVARYGFQAAICLQTVLFSFALGERISAYQAAQVAMAIGMAEAQAENRARGNFLAKMSHELRTPMSGLLGMLQLLEKTPLSDQQQHYMQVMRNAGRMLLSVINDVLDYSRIVAGKLSIHHRNFDLFSEVADLEAMFADAAQQKKIQLRFSVSPHTPNMVCGDVMRLRQILANLISNAIKFTEQGVVTVRLWVEQSSDSAWLLYGEVEDTGIGISQDQLATLFREYAQADGGKRYGGSGLGLVICKQLVELMQGTIQVQSAPGYGSVFHFHIAVSPPTSAVDDEGHHSGEKTISERRAKKVLIAEDNAINSEVILGMLKQLGYGGDVVRNGEEAVKAVCQDDSVWDLVLMDVEMPLLDGMEATKKIRYWEEVNCRNSIPVIALTAHAMGTHGESIVQAGMNDHIVKPVDLEQLQALLLHWLPEDEKTLT